ncbi:unnamed protein product [Chrysodeixis includens]|uniref:Uncharacterized protein n=1 Tax=Chrysodeixis includens TaxID=689277 RepID=A0A9P0BNM7_CHRIL|nr:unnamed protein product [Chrysodeixis includens]
MFYILLTELETTAFTSCKIQGLQLEELNSLKQEFNSLGLTHNNTDNFFEVDTPAVRVLNLLADKYYYRVSSQSMAMEKTNIGGRTIQIQKLVWTLNKK